MQFGFRRHLCSRILGKKQSKENVALGWASPRTPVIAALGRQWSQASRGAEMGNPSPRVPGHPVSQAVGLLGFSSYFILSCFYTGFCF